VVKRADQGPVFKKSAVTTKSPALANEQGAGQPAFHKALARGKGEGHMAEFSLNHAVAGHVRLALRGQLGQVFALTNPGHHNAKGLKT
jgi:hypothetical protein